MDPRTGLGRFREFRISNYDLMMNLIDYCKNHTIEEILQLPDVLERTKLYFSHDEKFRTQIGKCSKVYNNLIVLDLRNEETIWSGNRFLMYALYPGCNISIHVLWGFKKQNTVFAVGKSILKRDCQSNIGEVMLKYNGGGHNNAGTCQISNDLAEKTLLELIQKFSER